MSARSPLPAASFRPSLLALLVAACLLAGPALADGPPAPGLVVVDYADGVLHVDRSTGTAITLFSPGDLLPCPVGLVAENLDSILVSTVCTPGIVRYRISDDSQTLVASGGLVPNPDGMALDAAGTTLYETDLSMGAVVAIDLLTGDARVVKQDGEAAGAPFITVGADGNLYLANRKLGTGRVVRMHPVTGDETVVSTGIYLSDPKGIALAPSGDLIVVDLPGDRIVRVDPTTGEQEVVSSGGSLTAPYAIAVDNHNQAFVTNLFNGNIVQVDLDTGVQTLIQIPGVAEAYGISIYGAPGSPTPGTLPDVPPAPSFCAASDDRSDGIEVTWGAVPEAEGYRVYRDGVAIADVPSGTYSYFDTPSLGTYLYCVRSLGVGGVSEPTCDSGSRVLPPGGLAPGFLVIDWDDGLVHVDRATGEDFSLFTPGGLLPCPVAVVTENLDSVLVATVCAPGIVRFRISDGLQSLVAAGSLIPNPDGMVLDAAGGTLYETDLTKGAVVAIDLASGLARVVREGGLASGAPFITMGADRNLYLANRKNSIGHVVRMDPLTGAESIVTSAGNLSDPKGIALESSGHLIVVDLANKLLLRVDPSTGGQYVVSSGGWLTRPYAVAVDNDHQAFVTNLDNGNIVQVDLDTGTQSLIQVPGLTKAYGIAIYGAPGCPAPGPPPPPPAPEIQFVKDVPNDQGGRVLVGWTASALDAPPLYPISSYTLWRRVTVEGAQALLGQGARLVKGGLEVQERADRPALRLFQTADGPVYWEYIVSVPARGVPAYAYTATTTGDSLPDHIPWNVFFVDAVAPNGQFYVSAPDSGYSVDNLAPAAPRALAGTYTGATGVTLHWLPNREADLSHYAVYRDLEPEFVPSPETLVGTTPDTVYVDAVGSIHAYKVAAVDRHGNEGAFAAIHPGDIPVPTLVSAFDAEGGEGGIRLTLQLGQEGAGLTAMVWRGLSSDRAAAASLTPSPLVLSGQTLEYLDTEVAPGGSYWYWVDLTDQMGAVWTAGPVSASVPAIAPQVTFVAPAAPNPSSAGAVFEYTLGIDVTRGGEVAVRLELYDLHGRLVRTLKSASEGAGQFRVPWDGRDNGGVRVGPGVYHYRFRAGSLVRGSKVVVL